MDTLKAGLLYRDKIIGVGLDSSEVGFPPSLFAEVFARAGAEDLHLVAHAGEEGPPEYVWEALDILRVERVDHGVRSLEDPALVDRLVNDQIPLTVCPLSNVRLSGFSTLTEHTLPQMLELGLKVSINSDDPAYFGGYIADNYVATQSALDLPGESMVAIARNSIESSFLPQPDKARLLTDLDSYVAASEYV
jgi:adenosine deaminase